MADLNPSLAWSALSMPKAGHRKEEYEDAFAGDPAAGRFAIADGASESAFAGAWADLLVKGFTSQGGNGGNWLAQARKTWHDTFRDRELPWYAENKFQEGAFATFLGVAFHGYLVDGGGGRVPQVVGGGGRLEGAKGIDSPTTHHPPPSTNLRWQALAVGDSCLFHVRDRQLLQAFPVRHAKAFGNRPRLVGSRKASKAVTRMQREGDWQKGDELFLMTDALAEWFLHMIEDRQEPGKELRCVTTQAAFETWIKRKRETKEMRNDDVTLVSIGSR